MAPRGRGELTPTNEPRRRRPCCVVQSVVGVGVAKSGASEDCGERRSINDSVDIRRPAPPHGCWPIRSVRGGCKGRWPGFGEGLNVGSPAGYAAEPAGSQTRR